MATDYDAALAAARASGALSLYGAGLCAVPAAIPCLGARLLRLDLGANELQRLPALGSLTALRELFLNDNPLGELAGEALAGCVALRALDLSGTPLRTPSNAASGSGAATASRCSSASPPAPSHTGSASPSRAPPTSPTVSTVCGYRAGPPARSVAGSVRLAAWARIPARSAPATGA
jgi:hypothetical protein